MDFITIVDIVLALLVIGRVLVGLREGLIVGLLSLVGLVVGTISGLWVAPQVVAASPELANHRLATSLIILVTIIICLVVGHLVFTGIGKALRKTDQAHGVDAVLGAVASLLVISMLSWGVLTALRPVAPPRFAAAIDGSAIYQAIDKVIPDEYDGLPLRTVDALVTFLPSVFNGEEPVLPVSPPNEDSVNSTGVAAAGNSVVKVLTDAPSCANDSAGSGWVVADDRVVTNAHVVAGSSKIKVSIKGEGYYQDATLVGIDDDLDLAILSVPNLNAEPLVRAPALAAGDDAVAAGFPWGGAYTLSSQRVRDVISAAGSDIYGTDLVNREVYSLRGEVNPGNSGGPLLNTEGQVVGTIFAKSTIDSQTGYALTNAATDAWLDQAATFSQPVSSGACVA